MTALPSAYLKLLASDGRDLKEAGVNGSALPKAAALQAIGILRKAKVPILGGDVVRLTQGKLAVSRDNWYCKGAGDPGTGRYLAASLAQAEAFVRSYPDPGDGTVLYQFVVD